LRGFKGFFRGRFGKTPGREGKGARTGHPGEAKAFVREKEFVSGGGNSD